MQRYFIKLAYNGTPFNGWQIQSNAPTVQNEIEQALSKILRAKKAVVGCGRTDSGVHASEYFAHFEGPENIPDNLAFKLSCILPKEIAIFKIWPVDADMHARFSAEARTYHYFINAVKDPFTPQTSWFMHTTIDVDAMNNACKRLLGTKDFTSFSKLHTQTKTNICTVSAAFWEKTPIGYTFTVTANRFLHNMVRAIVGTCLEVGKGKMTAAEFDEVIESKSRQNAGASVPAHGLFLAKIDYPFFTN